MDILITYLLIINAVSFLFMLIDKRKAVKKAWRIPEATLLGIAAIGGSLGAVLAMRLFRHKTLHPKFAIGLPVLLAVHIIVLLLLYIKTA
jgi:uncharacterized membrane protein YsdA (DUF1294 family)